MRHAGPAGLAICLAVTVAASQLCANRLTFEVWPDSSPDHAIFCSVALNDGWITLVQVTGAGMPNPRPMRWRASQAEVDAVSDSLQAFGRGELRSVAT